MTLACVPGGFSPWAFGPVAVGLEVRQAEHHSGSTAWRKLLTYGAGKQKAAWAGAAASPSSHASSGLPPSVRPASCLS